MFSVLCTTCRQPFDAKRRSANFCGPTCRSKHHRNPSVYRRKTATLSTNSVAPGIRVVPLKLKEANAAVAEWHRHHKPVRRHTFSLGAMVVGAAIIFRPAALHCNSKEVAEVSRFVTDGTPHVASKLYAHAARACQAMGYRSIQIYIMDHEPGTSLRAAGWTFADRVDAKDINWGKRSKRGTGRVTTASKQRWVRQLAGKVAA
jgi:hypothetical protein